MKINGIRTYITWLITALGVIYILSLKSSAIDSIIYTRTIVCICIGYISLFAALYLGGKKIRESESLSVYCRKSAAAVEKYAV
ncbi:hypothetical protein, partial [Candidatus Magnetominusculus xianensis]|uniref:hypothetical protein n=1 Tax=Candidatus Magnetominusculus xianensis TaxID=1748249 RepID=UPI001F33113C